MAERYRKDWRELCNAAIAKRDADELKNHPGTKWRVSTGRENSAELTPKPITRRAWADFPPSTEAGAESERSRLARRPRWLLLWRHR